eukprot:12892271-Prorocentrum_lima.AAC.1
MAARAGCCSSTSSTATRTTTVQDTLATDRASPRSIVGLAGTLWPSPAKGAPCGPHPAGDGGRPVALTPERRGTL